MRIIKLILQIEPRNDLLREEGHLSGSFVNAINIFLLTTFISGERGIQAKGRQFPLNIKKKSPEPVRNVLITA